jgi:hypothetical protein
MMKATTPKGLLAQLIWEAKQLLRDNRLLLEQIAKALEAAGKITAGEVQTMMVNLQRAASRVTAA